MGNSKVLDIKIKYENIPIYAGQVRLDKFDNMMEEIKKKIQ